jgi:lysophospholipase L1-like esterase
MGSTTRLWRALGLTTLGCTLLLAFGFGWALRDTYAPTKGMALPEPSAPPQATGGSWAGKKEILAAAAGDSLTRGTGDATGNGYVRDTVSQLQQALGKPVRLLNNLGVNGQTTDELLKLLDTTGYKSELGQADLILLTIGANDLFRIATGSGSIAEGGDVSLEKVRARMPEAERRLQAVLVKLRKINPYARIVYVGLYNPFYDVKEMRAASGDIQKWNAYAQSLALRDGNATVVPTYDLFEANIGRYLSSDHFHPNADGYRRIAERIVQALR